MRLFIAIELSEEIKDALDRSARLLRGACLHGSFSRRENYHLTLVFLGETSPDRVPDIRRAMDGCAPGAIRLRIGPPGCFRRREGDILWRRIEADAALTQLHRDLSAHLRRVGFSLEERRYTPHLTLARRAELTPGTDLTQLAGEMPELDYRAESMTLMCSERIAGRLVYSPIYRRSLL